MSSDSGDPGESDKFQENVHRPDSNLQNTSPMTILVDKTEIGRYSKCEDSVQKQRLNVISFKKIRQVLDVRYVDGIPLAGMWFKVIPETRVAVMATGYPSWLREVDSPVSCYLTRRNVKKKATFIKLEHLGDWDVVLVSYHFPKVDPPKIPRSIRKLEEIDADHLSSGRIEREFGKRVFEQLLRSELEDRLTGDNCCLYNVTSGCAKVEQTGLSLTRGAYLDENQVKGLIRKGYDASNSNSPDQFYYVPAASFVYVSRHLRKGTFHLSTDIPESETYQLVHQPEAGYYT